MQHKSQFIGPVWKWLFSAYLSLMTVTLCLLPKIALAQGTSPDNAEISNRPILLLAALAGMALVPLVFIVITSFVKMAVVFAILRQALGTPQLPPTLVLLGLTMMMTLFVMSPVLFEIYHEGRGALQARGMETIDFKRLSPDLASEMTRIAQQPFREFMTKHAHTNERQFFLKMARKFRSGRDRESVRDGDFSIVTPAFMMSELKEAFQIGFILFMPFLVIDMVIGNILMALGMQMLSPTVIALPFKILMFVSVDGWHLVSKGLVLGYL